MTLLAPIAGLDLGTFRSSLAVAAPHGRLVSVANADGETTTPTCLWFHDDGVLTGQEALDHAVLSPSEVATGFTTLSDPHAPTFVTATGHFSPHELLRRFLGEMRADLEMWYGSPVQDLVVSTPVDVAAAQRQAIVSAARGAGFNVLGLMTDPLAASMQHALAVGHASATIVVVDMGHRQTHVSVLSTREGRLQVQAHHVDRGLGGEAIGQRLQGHLVERQRSLVRDDPLATPQKRLALSRVTRHCLAGLARREDVEFALGQGDLRVMHTLNQRVFIRLMDDLLCRLQRAIQFAMGKAGCRPRDVQEVLVIGGCARLGAVRGAIEQVMRRPLATDHDPDHAISMGAALGGALRFRPGLVPRSVRRRDKDPTPPPPAAPHDAPHDRVARFGLADGGHSLASAPHTQYAIGIRVSGPSGTGHIQEIFAAGTPLPSRVRGKIGRPAHHTGALHIAVVASGDPTPEAHTPLGTFELPSHPSQTQGTLLEVEYRVDEQHSLSLSVRDPLSGMWRSCDLQPPADHGEVRV